MKNLRLVLLPLAVLSTACLSGSGGKAAAAPQGAASPGASGGSNCVGQQIRTKADMSACTDACRDQQRDSQRQCSDPSCLQGLGAAASACFGKCEEGKRSAKTAGCYTE
jgi:hypothetical protein